MAGRDEYIDIEINRALPLFDTQHLLILIVPFVI
jgi:hypothetical protein